MANDLSGIPWTLDTVAGDFTDPTKSWSSRVFINHIEFIDYTLDTDTCQLVDFNGKVVWEGNGASDLKPVESFKIGWVNGLRLAAITAGKVRVYVK